LRYDRGIMRESFKRIVGKFKIGFSPLVIISGLVSLLLGVLVLLGWYTHNTSLIQINPAFVPMQYNTALGFFLSGVALLFLNTRHKKVSAGVGSAVFLIGLVTLLEYVFGIDLFLDQLFMEHYITVQTSSPGRMAPNTALCFTLTGFVALYHVLFERKRNTIPTIGIIGALIFGLGLVAFTGYFLNMEAVYGWGKLTRMAVHTAAGFIVIGSGYTFLSLDLGKASLSNLPRWFPLLLLIACLTFTISIWQALHVHELEHIHEFGSAYTSIADDLVLLFGVLFSVALAISIQKTLAARLRMAEAIESKYLYHKQFDKREKSEAALKESEKRIRDLIENVPIGISVSTAEGDIQEVNAVMLKIFGYNSKKEFMDTPAEALYCYPKDRERFVKLANEGLAKGLELQFRRKDGSEFWGSMTSAMVVDKTGQTEYIKALEDITERKLAEKSLQFRIKLESLTSQISSSFINLSSEETDNGINQALKVVGEFLNIDRSYVFLFSDDMTTMSNTHEWCADGIEPQRANLQDIPVETLPWWMEKLNNFENIQIPRVADLPPEASSEKEILEDQSIQSLIVIPIIYADILVGFLGLDSVRTERTWSEEAISLIKIIGEIIITAIVRRRAEISLESLRKQNEMILNTAGEGIYGLDLEGKTTFVNPAAAKMIGWNLEELIGKSQHDVLHHSRSDGTSYPRDECPIYAAFTDGEVHHVDDEVFWRKDGSSFPVEYISTPLKDEQGAVIGAVVTFNDITMRKLADEALRESEERYNLMVNTTGDVLYRLEFETMKYDYLSPAVTKLMGYSMDEVNEIGFSNFIAEIISPNDPEFSVENHVKTRKEGKFTEWHGELKVRTKSGKIKWLSDHSYAWKDHVGKTIGSVGILSDITKQKRVQEDLLQAEKKYRDIFNNTVIGVYRTTPNGRILEANPILVNMLGYSSLEELQKRNLEKEEFGEHSHTRQEFKEKIEKEGELVGLEAIWNKRNGDQVYIRENARAVKDEQGNIHYYDGTVEDISERKTQEENQKNLEAQLRQSQKLEAVGTMAGGIAHDFNNILQGLYLYSGIIKKQLPDDENLQANFQHTIDSGDRAKDLVKQILTFSRKEGIELKPVKIQYLLKNALKLTRASTPSTIGIKENINVDCGAVLCDATQLHQVFVNLCNNATHSMKEKGGTLSVSLQEIEAQIETVPGEPVSTGDMVVELLVNDTGHGMDSETLEQIFDPFFTTKDVDEGTGLGLSIVHGIIKGMQGQVKVESEPEKGTTFRILLPLSIEEEQQEEVQEETNTVVKGLRVLLVDDDKMISGAGKHILEDKGYVVDVANNGHEALELFHKDIKAYDLIITDLTMPKMTGLEFGKAVRKLSKNVPVILTTGNLDEKLKSEINAVKLNGFVRKPWTAPEMLKVINLLELD
jgi:PAS domain S-box-containing protein